MMTAPSLTMLKETIQDKDVVRSIWLSIYTAGLAALISFILGTPLAYLLARSNFRGKRLLEGIIDLGIRVMGSVTGIVMVLTFVGIPFYLNATKNGFESISPRLEKVSRSLGASMFSTFFRITFPLAWRSMLIGIIMCCARAISEFGAVVIIAYHPMIAPVMIYERFEAYGLRYSQPIAVWLVSVCLALFLILRILTIRSPKEV